MQEQQEVANAPQTIFYSYAHEDEPLQKELEKHLSSLRLQNIITTWHSREIMAGTDWKHEIDDHLEQASVILLLVSPDYLATEYCYGYEMQRALERHNAGNTVVIPIFLRPVDLHGAPFAHLQCLPFDKRPVTTWLNRDEAFFAITKGIREVIKYIKSLTLRENHPLLPPNITSSLSSGLETTGSRTALPLNVINTREAINLFHHLMSPDGQMRVLRLLGEEKMGKSHLLTKVFLPLAGQKYQTRAIRLDLRNPMHIVPDFLHSASRQLGIQEDSNYYIAYRDLMNQPKKGSLEQLLVLFSRLPRPTEDSHNGLYKRDFDLTMWFIEDLNKLIEGPLLFLIDNIDLATSYIQAWLLDTLLEHLSQLPTVRVVIAGHSLPEPCSSYADYCQSYHLSPVTDIEEYLAYCRQARLTLADSSVADFARFSRYVPGIFVECVVPTFRPQQEEVS